MKSLWCLGSLALCAALATAAQDDEQKIAPEKLPQAVKDAIAKRFAGQEITAAAREKEKDVFVYEATLKRGNRTMDVTYTEAGELKCVERKISVKELPLPVKKVVMDKYPGAKLEVIESITDYADNAVKDQMYEVLLQSADNKTVEVKLAAEWKIVETEDKSGKKD